MPTACYNLADIAVGRAVTDNEAQAHASSACSTGLNQISKKCQELVFTRVTSTLVKTVFVVDLNSLCE